MSEAINIPTASIATIRKTLQGRTVSIEDDVQGIAKQIAEIDSSLGLQVSEQEGELVWIVVQRFAEEDGSTSEHFVTDMVGELDQRILQRVRQVTGRGYDLIAEIDKAEAEADREQDRRRLEQMGPVAEKLAYAFKKDLHADKRRIFVP